jgi:hypothetical protein
MIQLHPEQYGARARAWGLPVGPKCPFTKDTTRQIRRAAPAISEKHEKLLLFGSSAIIRRTSQSLRVKEQPPSPSLQQTG